MRVITTAAILFLILIPLIHGFPWKWAYQREIHAQQQNTLYQEPFNAVPRCYGNGATFFVGLDEDLTARRALISFDVIGLFRSIHQTCWPTKVEIVFTVKESESHWAIVSLHPVIEDWGSEASGDLDFDPNVGQVAVLGDATWHWSRYNISQWTSPGGDYNINTSSSVNVTGTGKFTWTSPELLDIVYKWATNPKHHNYGWLIKVDKESEERYTTKEFFGVSASANQPKLILHYEIDPPIWFWLIIAAIGFFALVGAIFIGCYRYKSTKNLHSYVTLRDFGSIVKTSRSDVLNKLIKNTTIRIVPKSDIEFGSIIGTGGFGSVYVATIKSTKEVVAIKKLLLPESINESEDVLVNFSEEIKIMSTVAHPNVLSLVAVSLEMDDLNNKEYMLLTNLMPNGSLSNYLYNKKMNLSYLQKIRIATEICYGMHYLHSIRPRIIHRDLKTDNILLSSDLTVKIADFGLSKMVQHHSKTMTMSGTPAYMSPESIEKGKFSEKSDVYSYGIVLWELYTEQKPFGGITPYNIMYKVVKDELKPTIPEDCPYHYAELITICLNKEKKQRPNFKEIIEQLKIVKENFNQTTKPVSSAQDLDLLI